MINICINACIFTFGSNSYTVYDAFQKTLSITENHESDINVLAVLVTSDISESLVVAATGEGKFLLKFDGFATLLDEDLIFLFLYEADRQLSTCSLNKVLL